MVCSVDGLLTKWLQLFIVVWISGRMLQKHLSYVSLMNGRVRWNLIAAFNLVDTNVNMCCNCSKTSLHSAFTSN